MTEQQRRFDGVFMSVIQQKGNIDGFFDSVFGFLRRNTDFFTNEKKAQQIIVSSCKKNFDIFRAEKTKKDQEERKKKQREQKKKLEEKLKRQKQEQAKQAVKKVETKVEQVKIPQVKPSQNKQQKDEGPPPKGNGGKTDKYTWTQTLNELHMYIPVDFTVTSKNLSIKITIDSLYVAIKGNSPIINGKFSQKINVDDSIWTLEESSLDEFKGKYIHIAVEKWKNQTSWWATPIKGDPEINTQKINPEPSKLEDLEGQTRSTVQKMMFDMRQKQMGLPSSDELQKQDKLKEFMKAHPQMDFSNCKFG